MNLGSDLSLLCNSLPSKTPFSADCCDMNSTNTLSSQKLAFPQRALLVVDNDMSLQTIIPCNHKNRSKEQSVCVRTEPRAIWDCPSGWIPGKIIIVNTPTPCPTRVQHFLVYSSQQALL